MPICQGYAQSGESRFEISNTCRDTISCNNELLIITLPIILYKYKSVEVYEEGRFVIYPYRDSAYIFIHNGANTIRPFCDTSFVNKKVDNDSLVYYCGHYADYWTQEIYFKSRGITISCVNFREDELPIFDYIISNLKFALIPKYSLE